jgi:hypothetical protein
MDGTRAPGAVSMVTPAASTMPGTAPLISSVLEQADHRLGQGIVVRPWYRPSR